MSVQVAVRLPDELAAWIDEQVRDGVVASRAAAAAVALEEWRRRRAREADAKIYAERGEKPDLQGLADWAGQRGFPDLED